MTINERILRDIAKAVGEGKAVNSVVLGPEEHAEFKAWFDSVVEANAFWEPSDCPLLDGEVLYQGNYITKGEDPGIHLSYQHRLEPRYFAKKHEGLFISAEGLLGRIERGTKPNKGQRFMVGEMLKHLRIMSSRFYAGDIKVVDEFLQLYRLDDDRPKGGA